MPSCRYRDILRIILACDTALEHCDKLRAVERRVVPIVGAPRARANREQVPRERDLVVQRGEMQRREAVRLLVVDVEALGEVELEERQIAHPDGRHPG